MKRTVLMSALLAMVLGCEDERRAPESPASPGDAGDARDAGDPQVPLDATVATDSGSPQVDAEQPPADAASSDTGTSPAAVTAQTLLPIAVGNVWTFAVTSTVASPDCPVGAHASRILGQVERAGRQAFTLEVYCGGGMSTISSTSEGIQQAISEDAWSTTLANPVEQDHEWPYTAGMSFAWNRVGRITVPAGTFDDCWERLPVDSMIATTTYCHEIGPVRAVGSDFEAVLTAFDLQ